MSYQDDIAALTSRLRKAEAELQVWRAAGMQERYLEAYFLVDSLETEMLERMRRERTDHPPV